MNPFHTRMFCTMFGWNWPSGSEKKKISQILSMVFYILRLEKGMPFFEHSWISFPQICLNLVEIGSVILEEKILKCSQCIFAILLLSSLWKREWPFI